MCIQTVEIISVLLRLVHQSGEIGRFLILMVWKSVERHACELSGNKVGGGFDVGGEVFSMYGLLLYGWSYRGLRRRQTNDVRFIIGKVVGIKADALGSWTPYRPALRHEVGKVPVRTWFNCSSVAESINCWVPLLPGNGVCWLG